MARDKGGKVFKAVMKATNSTSGPTAAERAEAARLRKWAETRENDRRAAERAARAKADAKAEADRVARERDADRRRAGH